MAEIFATAEECRFSAGGLVFVGASAIATAGDACIAVAGEGGRATAGDSGIAIVGCAGDAIAGDGGIAISCGTASAGERGVLILYWHDPAAKYCLRLAVRHVGEDGIEPGVAYRCTRSGDVVPAVAPVVTE